MKKNMMMRIASVLLVAVLASTCAISGTFAKYVTRADGDDSARVAKWGVTVAVDGTTFAEAYATDATLDVEAASRVGVNSVVSDGSPGIVNDLVAPGTKGDMVGITLGGTPEVAVKVTYVSEVELGDYWKDQNNDFYCPIIVTINGVAYSATGTGCDEADEFEAFLEERINNYTKAYAAKTNLADYAGENLTISWEWPYYVDEATDVKDTYLGDSAAGMNDGLGAATISITVECTVTQVD